MDQCDQLYLMYVGWYVGNSKVAVLIIKRRQTRADSFSKSCKIPRLLFALFVGDSKVCMLRLSFYYPPGVFSLQYTKNLHLKGTDTDLKKFKNCSWAFTRSEEHTSELQSPVPISYAVFCLKKKNKTHSH